MNHNQPVPLCGRPIAPVTSTQVQSWIESLRKEIAMLSEVVATHSAKISPVLMPDHPTDTPNEKAQESLVPVANDIRGCTLSVQAIRQVIESLTRRTEA